ncbi:MAG: hypothetical protein LAO05_15145 [Acidobacteriia bacterium]|nr:hypothetical protein [Terriglobia bacterium]
MRRTAIEHAAGLLTSNPGLGTVQQNDVRVGAQPPEEALGNRGRWLRSDEYGITSGQFLRVCQRRYERGVARDLDDQTFLIGAGVEPPRAYFRQRARDPLRHVPAQQ